MITMKNTLIENEKKRLSALGHGEAYIKVILNEKQLLNTERERMRSLGYSPRYINHLLD